MEQEFTKGIIEAILFAAGREVNIKELSLVLEKSKDEIEEIIKEINLEYQDKNRGIEIVQIEDNFQMATRKEYYDYIYRIIDKRNKPKLSNAALETLSIIAYNPRISRAEIEAIRRSKCRWYNVQIIGIWFNRRSGKARFTGKANVL